MKKLSILVLMMMSLNCLNTAVWAGPTDPTCTANDDATQDKNVPVTSGDGNGKDKKSTATTLEDAKKDTASD